jgi:hypothetical protein
VNVPPMIATLPAQSVTVGAEITFGIPASDTDLPPQSLSFDLLSAPTGAVVNAAGTFSWTPSAAQAPSTNAIVVRAIDNGTPSLSATQSFTIVVSAGNERMAFERITRGADGVVQVQLRGAAGVWELQRSANLLTWQPLRRLTNHTGPLTHTDTTATNATQRFYRAVKQ